MAKKGPQKKLKRFAAPKTMHIHPKEGKFAVRVQPGPHSIKRSVPLGYLIRDVFKIAETMREAKLIISQGKVKVNGIIRKSHKFPVGLFDIVSVDGLEHDYRMLYDKKGRLKPEKIEQGGSQIIRPSKVVRKMMIKGGKIQITTDDGRNIIVNDREIKVNDTVMLKLPKQEILEVKKLEPNALVYIIGGPHVGKHAIVKEVKPGSEKNPKIVVLKQQNKEFETIADNVFVISDDVLSWLKQ